MPLICHLLCALPRWASQATSHPTVGAKHVLGLSVGLTVSRRVCSQEAMREGVTSGGSSDSTVVIVAVACSAAVLLLSAIYYIHVRKRQHQSYLLDPSELVRITLKNSTPDLLAPLWENTFTAMYRGMEVTAGSVSLCPATTGSGMSARAP